MRKQHIFSVLGVMSGFGQGLESNKIQRWEKKKATI